MLGIDIPRRTDLQGVAEACSSEGRAKTSVLRAFRLRAGLTQVEAAQMLGVSARTLYRSEKSRARPRLEWLLKFGRLSYNTEQVILFILDEYRSELNRAALEMNEVEAKPHAIKETILSGTTDVNPEAFQEKVHTK